MATFSIVMAAYDRAHTLPRAIASVQAQTRGDWELVVVDDGSKDDTAPLVGRLAADDPRIRLVRHEKNRGVTAAKNTGFDHATGDWILTLDSDDEMVPQALAVFARTFTDHPELDAIACNCFDSRTGRLTGRGLDRDRPLTLGERLDRCRGEHWGTFHRRILGSHRFDERIRGYEDVLWTTIHEHARWWYVHRGLRVYHTEGSDRLTRRASLADERRLYELYRSVFEHAPDFPERLQRNSERAARRFLFNAAGQFLLHDDAPHFAAAIAQLARGGTASRATGRALVAARAVRRVLPLPRPGAHA
jgi:glycosyltransferase involved in cell wall biosynthesis